MIQSVALSIVHVPLVQACVRHKAFLHYSYGVMEEASFVQYSGLKNVNSLHNHSNGGEFT